MARIYLSSPHMGGREKHYVGEAFDTNWIAPLGPNVNGFEKDVADYVGVPSAAALSSGTAAIHLALRACGVRRGDYVFCSALTFSATCNPIVYEGGLPVFIDAEPCSFNMSPSALEEAFARYTPAAVITVNLYGQSAEYDTILEICNRHKVPVIEDAAESLGATYKGKMSGTFGKVGIFSFNGNKIITTSGGGMAVSHDEEIIEKMRFWATQSRDPAPHYQHSELGFNYRMSNICAGIGRGQMEVLPERIRKKREIYAWYKEALADLPVEMKPEIPGTFSTHWLSVMLIQPDCPVKPMDIVGALEAEDIECRPIWKPMNLQPYFRTAPFFQNGGRDVGKDIFTRGLCLPSDTKMDEADMERISSCIHKVFGK